MILRAKLAKIGDDHFLDLYPVDGMDDEYTSRNLFPVHTFMKLNLSGDYLEIVQFDMSKLTDLFKSNQIRLRHEKVDGAIMITAQPKEIQKFLDSYSEDEEVFENPEIYKRIHS